MIQLHIFIFLHILSHCYSIWTGQNEEELTCLVRGLQSTLSVYYIDLKKCWSYIPNMYVFIFF